MDFVASFNFVEAGWWLIMAAACLWQARGRWQQVGWIAAIFFLLFAGTDVIEYETGAWWRPWWLAVMKAICLVGLAGCGIRACRLRNTA